MSKSVALIGTGPAGFGYVQGLANLAKEGKLRPEQISELHIFERSNLLGAGLPYDENIADPEHLLNTLTISGAFPKRGKDFFDWMREPRNHEEVEKHFRAIHQKRLEKKLARTTDEGRQAELREHYDKIWESIKKRYLNLKVGETYHPRVLYGVYASMEFEKNLAKIREAGIDIFEHRLTDATSMEKTADGKLQIGFSTASSRAAGAGGGMIAVDECILATGRWQELPRHSSNSHCPDIWPTSRLGDQLDAAIIDEMAKRAAEGNPDKVFRIAIEGTSLSAIDALKTCLQDSLMKVNDDGSMSFEVAQRCGATLKVDMVSRGGMMQKVKCEKFYFDKFRNEEGVLKLATLAPAGIKIDTSDLTELSVPQEGKIRLWQLMAMTLRAAEIGYRSEGLPDKADAWRASLLQLLAQVKRKDGAEERSLADINSFLDSLSGTSAAQALAMTEFFGLELDGANYGKILEGLQSAVMAPGEDPITRLRADMEMAADGDTAAGELIWQNIYYQNDWFGMRQFLTPEEEILRFQILERFHGVLNNAMPIQTAREMLAMHEAGAFGVVALGFNSTKTFISQSGEVTSERDRQALNAHTTDDRGVAYGDLKYDFSIAARGISLNLENAPPLYQSMAANGLVTQRKILFCSTEEFEEKKTQLLEKYGVKDGAEIIKTLKQEADGNVYYYNRMAIPQNPTTRQTLDASGSAVLCENLRFIPSSGIVGSIGLGENLAIQQFDLPAKVIEGTIEAAALASASKGHAATTPPM